MPARLTKFPYCESTSTSNLANNSKRRSRKCTFSYGLQITFIVWIGLSIVATFILPYYYQPESFQRVLRRIPSGYILNVTSEPAVSKARSPGNQPPAPDTIYFVLATPTPNSIIPLLDTPRSEHAKKTNAPKIVLEIKYAKGQERKTVGVSPHKIFHGKQSFPRVEAAKVSPNTEQPHPHVKILKKISTKIAYKSKQIKFNYGYKEDVAMKVGLNRTIPDGRHESCKTFKYKSINGNVSIIVTVFNEAWHVLLRTLHSIMDRTPHELISEVIVVDDHSDEKLTSMRKHLQEYVQRWKPFVRFKQNLKREGVIRSRNRAAMSAIGRVVVFLDSHVEVNVGWLEPLLDIIDHDWRVVAVPVVDKILPTTWEYKPVEKVPKIVDAFLWNLKEAKTYARRQPVNGSGAEPIEVPIASHGQFAISTKFFKKLGGYDEGMEVMGGENLEISFKAWMCGGKVMLVLCSRIGHVIRGRHALLSGSDASMNTQKNLMRIAKVWMDDYSKYFEDSEINLKEMEYGDISARVRLRNELKCKSFEWYLQTVFPQLYNPKGRLIADTDISNLGMHDDLCLDALTIKHAQVGMFPCHGKGGNQRWWYTTLGELRRYDFCLDYWGHKVQFYPCHGKEGNQLWVYLSDVNLFKHAKTGECLTAVSKIRVEMRVCDEHQTNQKWILRNFNNTAYEEAGFGI